MSSSNNLNDDYKSRLSGSTWRPTPGPFDTQKEESPDSMTAAKLFSRAEYKHYEPSHSLQNSSSRYANKNSLMESSSGRGRERFRELKSYKERYQDVKEMSTSPSRRSTTPNGTRSYSAERYAARERERSRERAKGGLRSRSYDKYTARQRARELSPHERYAHTRSPGSRNRANEQARRSRSRSADKYRDREVSPVRVKTNRIQTNYMDRWESRKEQKARKMIDPDGSRASQTYSNRADRWSPKEDTHHADGFVDNYSHQRRSSRGDGSPLFDDVDEEGAGNIHVGNSSPLSIGNHFDDISEDQFKGEGTPRAPRTPRTPGTSNISGTPRYQTPRQSPGQSQRRSPAHIRQTPRRSPGQSVSSKSSSKSKSTYADDLASFTQNITTAVISNQGSTYDAESQSYEQKKRTTTKNKMNYAAFALIFIFLCIIAAVVAIVHLQNMKKDKTAVPVAVPTPTPPTETSDTTIGTRFPTPSASSGQSMGEREKLIDQYLESLSSRSSTIGSPQFKAKEWLLFDDDLNLHLPHSGENRDESEVTMRLQQRFALATMYYSMGVGDGGVVKGWLQGDECRFVGDYGRAWDGVDCNEDGKVRAIALDAANLQGSLPPEIALLTDIENLIIKNNPNLSGEIPHGIGNKLLQLRQLGFYGNNLGGSIPKTIFKLSHLVYLNLSDNALTGEVNWEEMSHHQKKIERLILHNNFLEGSIDFHLLAKTPLLLLVLSNNQFGGYIDESVGSMTSLEYLYLDKNELIGSIPNGIGNLPNIKSITLDENELYGTLPQTMGSLANLEHFSAKKNTISGGFPATLKMLHNLVTLNLSSNAMSGHLRNLPHMKSLKNLHLYQNGFVGSIPETLFELPNLEVLFLSSNLLTGEIPSSITSAQQTLKALYLSDNKLQGQIPNDLCGLYKLEDLFIDTNDFYGPLPTCLGSLSNLKKLYAFKNRLTGDVPSVLLNLPNLVEIGIEENDITGGVNQVCAWGRGLNIWADCSELEDGCDCCERCCSDFESNC